MKVNTFSATLAVLISAVTLPAFAQSAQPVTRAQVKQELAALENAGYNPAYSHGPDYPENLQAAERKVAAEKMNATQYGPSTDGTSEAGSR